MGMVFQKIIAVLLVVSCLYAKETVEFSIGLDDEDTKESFAGSYNTVFKFKNESNNFSLDYKKKFFNEDSKYTIGSIIEKGMGTSVYVKGSYKYRSEQDTYNSSLTAGYKLNIYKIDAGIAYSKYPDEDVIMGSFNINYEPNILPIIRFHQKTNGKLYDWWFQIEKKFKINNWFSVSLKYQLDHELTVCLTKKLL